MPDLAAKVRRGKITRSAHSGLLWYVLCVFSASAYCQWDWIPKSVDEVEWRDSAQIETEREQSYAILSELIENPIDINQCSIEQLMQLPAMSINLAQRIVREREVSGGWESVDQWAQLDGVSELLVASWRPYVAHVHGLRAKSESRAILTTDRRASSQREDSKYLSWNYQSGTLGLRIAWIETRELQARYSESSGTLVTDDEHTVQRPAQMMLWSKADDNEWIVGDYQIGFGRGLVFSTQSHDYRNQWTLVTPPGVDMQTGALRFPHSLYGLATNLGKESGRWQAAAYVSDRYYDLYQYDQRYVADLWLAPYLPECVSVGSQSSNYECDELGRWTSSRILASTDGESVSYQTIANGYREEIVGGYSAWRVSPALQTGLIGYRSRVTMSELLPYSRFANHSTYSYNHPYYYASGAFLHWKSDPFVMYCEFARTVNAGQAMLVEVQRGGFLVDWITRAWYYDRNYINPHSRGDAMADEALGSRHRNEEALEFRLQSHWHAHQRWEAGIVVWRHPFSVTGYFDDTPVWRHNASPWNRQTEIEYAQRFFKRHMWYTQLQWVRGIVTNNGDTDAAKYEKRTWALGYRLASAPYKLRLSCKLNESQGVETQWQGDIEAWCRTEGELSLANSVTFRLAYSRWFDPVDFSRDGWTSYPDHDPRLDLEVATKRSSWELGLRLRVIQTSSTKPLNQLPLVSVLQAKFDIL